MVTLSSDDDEEEEEPIDVVTLTSDEDESEEDVQVVLATNTQGTTAPNKKPRRDAEPLYHVTGCEVRILHIFLYFQFLSNKITTCMVLLKL